MKIEPGVMINNVFYRSGERVVVTVSGKKHDCIFLRAHQNELNPEVVVMRVKSLEGKKYPINDFQIDNVERMTG